MIKNTIPFLFRKYQKNVPIMFLGIVASSFGKAYCELELNLTKLMRKMGNIWCVVILAVFIAPFVVALIDYYTGNYSVASWKFIHMAS